MSFKLVAQAFDIKVGNPLRKMVLLKLADQANDKGVCWPSYESIAQACEISRRTVIDHIKWLEQNNYLRIERRYNEEAQRNYSNLYHLTLNNVQSVALPPSANAALPSANAALPSANAAPLGSETPAPPSAAAAPEPIKEPISKPINEAEPPTPTKIETEEQSTDFDVFYNEAITHLKASGAINAIEEVNHKELRLEVYGFDSHFKRNDYPEHQRITKLIAWFGRIELKERVRFWTPTPKDTVAHPSHRVSCNDDTPKLSLEEQRAIAKRAMAKMRGGAA